MVTKTLKNLAETKPCTCNVLRSRSIQNQVFLEAGFYDSVVVHYRLVQQLFQAFHCLTVLLTLPFLAAKQMSEGAVFQSLKSV